MKMMNGGAAADPDAMKNMMQSPSMQNILKNPEMLEQSINMVKNNPAMLEMMSKQMPEVDPKTMVKGLEWLASLAKFYSRARNVCQNKLVQASLIFIMIYLIF